MQYPTQEQIKIFISLFKGRNDIYAKRWDKNGRGGYSPAYQFNWHEFMAFRENGGTMKDFSNKTLLPLNLDVIQKHLSGYWHIGIYPLLDNNTSYFIAADFDKKNWELESKAFIDICEKFKIPAYLEKSRSGNGAHVWIFFKEPYPAFKSRKVVFELIRKALKFSEFEKEISFDRLFPSQDYHSKMGFGNLIALPLNGKCAHAHNTCFLKPQTFQVIDDQWEFLKNIKKLSTDELNNLYEELADSENEDSVCNIKSKGKNKTKSNVLNIFIRNQIFLKRSELNGKLIRYLRDELNFFNTEYLIKKRIGKSTYKTEKYFNVIQESDEEIMIPRGFVKEVTQFCKDNKFPYSIIDERKLLKPVKFTSKINLYGYQEEALDITEEKDFGVIVAPPGAGKTVMGLELIAEKGQPALILVHRKQLLDQWIERIQSFLKIPKKDIGQIYSAKKKVGKKITVAMMQSLVKMQNIDELKNKFGTIIVDECHHIPAKTFRETIVKLSSYYLYGLTATPKRKHNDEKLIFVYIGNIIAEIDHHYDKKGRKKALPNINISETKLQIPFDLKTDNIGLLSKILVYDTLRNQQIADDVLKAVNDGKRVLILTERKGHVEILNLYLKEKMETITITGDDSISGKKSKMAQIKMGHFQALISTGQFFGEGMDVENLDCLFIAYPFSFEGKLIQYIGRIQRSENQQIIFDYRDKKIDYFEKLFKKRNRYYRKLQKNP